MSRPRSIEAWRRAVAMAEFELESHDRRMAVRPPFLLFDEALRMARRQPLVDAVEAANLGWLRATHAAERKAEAEAARPLPARRPRPGPIPIERRDVEAVRDQLDATDPQRAPHGYGSIAKAGGWSESTVKRRLTGH